MDDKERVSAELNKQYYLINKILEDVHQIFTLIQPSIIRMVELKDSILLDHSENFRRAALKFIEISKLSKEIEDKKSLFDLRNKLEIAGYFS
ncbi:MAG: hypothetical protein KGD73_00455 [Candidatus Lokiarchaeota archaeon]|nr:hypothetical protein [Candidatus Lokiarchaeota archaeon]